MLLIRSPYSHSPRVLFWLTETIFSCGNVRYPRNPYIYGLLEWILECISVLKQIQGVYGYILQHLAIIRQCSNLMSLVLCPPCGDLNLTLNISSSLPASLLIAPLEFFFSNFVNFTVLFQLWSVLLPGLPHCSHAN